jgi:hypothetical protein
VRKAASLHRQAQEGHPATHAASAPRPKERENMSFKHGHPGIGIAAALLLAVSAHSAREYYMYDGASTWETVNYVNFYTFVNAGVDHWPRYPFSGGDELKYYDYSLTIPSGTACFEIETQAAEDDVTNNDTRIWTWDGTNGFRSLDDDSGPGWYSKARAFLSGDSKLSLWFAAYSSTHNTMKFETRIRRLPLGESSCTTSQSLPWIKQVNNTTSYSANAN